MPASFASLRTSSHPVVTTGAMTIASTPWLMKLRTAAIWFSGLLSAALKMSLKPFFAENASFIDSVLAERQPLSEPVCAKPTVMTLPPPPPDAVPPPAPLAQPVAASAIAPMSAKPARILFFIPQPPRLGPAASPGVLLPRAASSRLAEMLAVTLPSPARSER